MVQQMVLSDLVIVSYSQGNHQLIATSARSHMTREQLLSIELESEGSGRHRLSEACSPG